MSDLIDRQDAIDAVNAYLGLSAVSRTIQNMTSIQEILENLPSAEPKIIKCKDCKWWEKEGGYCHAIKHCHYTRNWEIQIYRTYPQNFYCADAEPREERR